ncbi:uncharacterized protein LOC126778478 isoform X2 [Nymphalis io]|uniref:uncharacterized protein LOC126778478 isoform X2 n=1 Tax=Inachis io TaxID=171585 RepID=UPI00216A4040|nr:uncharacterized protein LOC126778478 isoform X2 [Nymphalis io]
MQRPKLQMTKLGWLVSGIIHTHTKHNNTNNNTEHSSSCHFLQNDESILNRFWELEAVSSEHCLSQEERACERTFAETTARNSDGRFVVTIPLKDSPEVLGDSYAAAKRRLLSLERRFLRDSLLKERYLQFMSEYLALGHMSENKKIMSDKNINYYLPHHGVIRESSTTTKLRVVFDASAVTTTGKSYNNIQMVGPIVQDDLLSILLRFRQHKYVISGDIEKIYRDILVTPSQRHLQQILFRFNSKEPIKSYTLNTVTYGTSSAPYLATKCLVTLADTCTDIEVKNSIRRDFYVDDYLSGGDSVASVIELAKNVTKIMDTAKFNLRKWQSNNTTILHSITQNTNQQQSEKTLDLND